MLRMYAVYHVRVYYQNPAVQPDVSDRLTQFTQYRVARARPILRILPCAVRLRSR